MKQVIKVLAATTLLAFATFANAKIEASVGVIDTDSIMKNSPQVKAISDRMQKEFEPRAKKLDADQKAIQAKHDALRRDRDILSEKERLEKERNLSKLQQDFQREAEEFEVDRRARQQDELTSFQKVLDGIVGKVAKAEGVDIVIPSQVTMFNEQKIELTDKVLAQLKKEKS